MANRLYNKQVSPKGYKNGGRVKKMGGGMMKRPKMQGGGKLKMVMKGGKKVPFFAADGKGAKDLGRVEAKKGGKINAGLKAYLAKKKKMKKKK